MKRSPDSRPGARHGALLAALTLLAAAGASAQPARHGPQFQVNTYGMLSQDQPAVAIAPDGGFVVAWSSQGDETDQDLTSAHARRYDANGAPLGPAFRVNGATTSYQWEPALAFDPQGNFVVTWSCYAHEGTDTEDGSIRARRYDAAGTPGVALQINTSTAAGQRLPSLAFDPASGESMVVWEDHLDDTIRAQRYQAGGAADGGEVDVSVADTDSESDADVAPLGDGGFIVVWHGFGEPDDPDRGVYGRRFDATGEPTSAPFQVHQLTAGNQERPAVATDGAGGFVVAWTSDSSAGDDSDASSIQARRFDGNGPVGDQFQVNTYGTGYQSGCDIAMDPRGHFVVVWRSSDSAGPDTDGDSVQARRHDETGTPLGAQFEVNTYTTGSQAEPAVATDASGNFVVAWASFGSPGSDQDQQSVQAQRFDDVFREDFEAGDWTRWSAAVP